MILMSGSNGKSVMVDRLIRREDTILISLEPSVWRAFSDRSLASYMTDGTATPENVAQIVKDVLASKNYRDRSLLFVVYTNLRRHEVDPFLIALWKVELEQKEQGNPIRIVVTYFSRTWN